MHIFTDNKIVPSLPLIYIVYALKYFICIPYPRIYHIIYITHKLTPPFEFLSFTTPP